MSLFVIAIGGTGMRCLESFTHLCAAGLFSNQEINILTLDTDQNNGNKARVEQLIQLYNRIKTPDATAPGGRVNRNTFFAAKLNLYKFWTDYENADRQTYRGITQLGINPDEQANRHNKLLSDLFLEEGSVQTFNLAHGYRAQTHLGSFMMYHGIIEAARSLRSGTNVESHEQELGAFLDKLAAAVENARVFIFGSVFGGTGASSIPILPQALRDAVSVRSNGQATLDVERIKFGATLLTEYFTFPHPTEQQKQTNGNAVIADAAFFPINSQAALQFYQSDPTVKQVYKRLYHIGWPNEVKGVDNPHQKREQVITGGAEQKNGCHVVELLSACAAYDFLMSDHQALNQVEYLYRAVTVDDKGGFQFSGSDMMGGQHGKLFEQKLSAFFAFAHIALTVNGGASHDKGVWAFRNRLQQNNIQDYTNLEEEDLTALNQYLRAFAYSVAGDQQEAFTPGWIYQVQNSIAQAAGRFSVFSDGAFPIAAADRKALDVGTLLGNKDYHWPGGTILGMGTSRFDAFVNTLVNIQHTDAQQVASLKEQFLARIHNAIMRSQKNEVEQLA